MTVRRLGAWILAALLAGPAVAGGQAIDAEDYPSLDARQIGHLRHFVKLSRQLPGD